MTSTQQRAELQHQIWQIANYIEGGDESIHYAANAGKSGGEFFTPQHASKLIAQLAMHGQTSVNKIYDPAAGSGSLLLQAKKHFDTQFIDASSLFKKATNSNVLTDHDDEKPPGHIQQIMVMFDSKVDVEHIAKSVPFDAIAANDYNLSVSSYVEAKDTREVIDIAQLNAEIKTTVTKIDQLRTDIDAIVAEIEGTEIEGAEA